MRRARKLGLVVAISLLVAGIAAGSAAASTVTLDRGGVLRYAAAPGETSQLALSFDYASGSYVIQDTGVAAMTVNARGCTAAGPQTARCAFGSFTSIDAHLGDGGSGYAIDSLDVTTVSIHGGAAADTLVGGLGGNVTLDGGGGFDTLTARGGHTTLQAGPGGAQLNGGTGTATYQGSPEADDIHARNGVAETVTCGGGPDTVDADTTDKLSPDCETVSRGEVTPTPTAPTTGGDTTDATPVGQLPSPAAPPLVAISRAPVALDAHQRVPVGLSCPSAAATGCTGVVVLSMAAKPAAHHKVIAARRGRRVVGRSRRFKITAGRKLVVPVQLSRRGARVFRARKRKPRRSVKLDAAVTIQTEAGAKTTHATITVKARRRVLKARRRR